MLTNQITELYFTRFDLVMKGQPVDEINRRIHELEVLRNQEREYELTAYNRPTKGLIGLLSRPLGPLPKPWIIQPTRENLSRVRSQVPLALLTVAGAIGALIALSVFVPWLRMSPYSVLYVAFHALIGGWAVIPAIGGSVIFGMILSRGMTGHAYAGKTLDNLAMNEEQWFRMGAENWTGMQRLYSCAAFGVMHVINVIYPLTSLIVLSGVGGVFMLAYLRAFARTGSAELATLTSTRLHATYNRFAVAYLAVALAITGYVIVTR